VLARRPGAKAAAGTAKAARAAAVAILLEVIDTVLGDLGQTEVT